MLLSISSLSTGPASVAEEIEGFLSINLLVHLVLMALFLPPDYFFSIFFSGRASTIFLYVAMGLVGAIFETLEAPRMFLYVCIAVFACSLVEKTYISLREDTRKRWFMKTLNALLFD